MKKIIISVLFIAGLILLVINITGLFKTMRNPELYTLENQIKNRIGDVKIPYPDIRERLVRREGESEKDFMTRVNSLVHDGFAHYWKKEGIDKFYMRVPIWENYLLYAASYINPARYERYEFSSYKKGLERGVGVCSGHSIVVKGVLKENGINAELLDVGGRHVVVRAALGDSAIILDPDFGIVVPFDTASLTANPELARAPYSRMAALYYPEAKEPYTTELMVEIFGKHKHVYDVNNWFEYFSYWAIWFIPLLLMLPLLLALLRRSN
ncbi:hypothetical protein [Chitinophaga sp.]|uniref:hypothetical protein n=1 Tax=Chitinophaga sp. TaxID=1869181 RepID=UPI0031D031CF